MTNHDSPGLWRSQAFPGVEKAAFRISNDWAKAMLAWDQRVRAMCLIMQVKLDVSEAAFADVLESVEAGKHSPAEIERILRRHEEAGKKPAAPVLVASDVVGHPPPPPFGDGGL